MREGGCARARSPFRHGDRGAGAISQEALVRLVRSQLERGRLLLVNLRESKKLVVFYTRLFSFYLRMDISLDKCCVGVVVNSECFKHHFTTSSDLLALRDLPSDTQRIIKLRVNSEAVRLICAHHYSIYYVYYETPRFHFSKNCCDPFKKHKRVVRGIKKIDLELSDSIFASTSHMRLTPGKTLCPRCTTQLSTLLSQPLTPQTQRINEYEPNDEPIDEIFNPFEQDRVVTPRRVIDALSNAAVITPIAEVTRSNVQRRSRLCADALENLKRKKSVMSRRLHLNQATIRN